MNIEVDLITPQKFEDFWEQYSHVMFEFWTCEKKNPVQNAFNFTPTPSQDLIGHIQTMVIPLRFVDPSLYWQPIL